MVFSSSHPEGQIAGVSTVLMFTSFMMFTAGSAFCDWVGVMCLHKLSDKCFIVICDKFDRLFSMEVLLLEFCLSVCCCVCILFWNLGQFIVFC